jgi:hypothetical protein
VALALLVQAFLLAATAASVDSALKFIPARQAGQVQAPDASLLRQEADWWVLDPQWHRLPAILGAAGAYIGICFAPLMVIVVMAIAAKPIDLPAWILPPTFIAAIAGAWLAARILGKGPILKLQPQLGLLELHETFRTNRLKFDDIRAWKLYGVQSRYTSWGYAPVMVLVTTDGKLLHVRAFDASERGVQLAEATAQEVARITGKPVDKSSDGLAIATE